MKGFAQPQKKEEGMKGFAQPQKKEDSSARVVEGRRTQKAF